MYGKEKYQNRTHRELLFIELSYRFEYSILLRMLGKHSHHAWVGKVFRKITS